MNQDQNTQNYLSLFQSASDSIRSIVQRMNWLPDAKTIPDALLKWLFQHHGMPYPSWSTTKRNLPDRFEEFHAVRHTVDGFVAYFSSLSSVESTVGINVSQAQPRSLFHFGVAGIGFPNAEMLAHGGQVDQCFYLYKDQPIVITIDVEGDEQVGEFVRGTAKLEVPFGDSPSCEIVVNVI